MRPTLSLTAIAASLLLAGCPKTLVCPQGETNCAGRCVDLLTSHDSCGSCGAAVGKLESCREGRPVCAAGIAPCGDGNSCTDLARDPAHCGSCTSACSDGNYCTTQASGTTCEATCPTGFVPCDGACVDLKADRFHCGGCGITCSDGQACRDGTCGAALQVACFVTGDIRPLDTELAPAGDPRQTGGQPTVLATDGTTVYAGNSGTGGVMVLPLDPRLPTHLTSLAGTDIEGLDVEPNAVLVSNAAVSTVVVLKKSGAVLDEVALPGDKPEPHGLAVLGSTAYVALYGDGPGGFDGFDHVTGQKIARIDLADLAACVSGTRTTGCATLDGTIDLLGVPGTADEGGYPFPSRVATHEGKVYVTLANLARADCGGGFFGYCVPAGNGKLAVIDPAAGDAVTVVDLGASCKNPGAITFRGTTAWIACGSLTLPSEAPGAILPVELSGSAPVIGAAVDASSVVPGSLAFCGELGYVTDLGSGAVLRFNPTTGQAEAPKSVCPPLPSSSFTWAADVACP